MTTTTFAALKSAKACEEGYRKLAKHLGGIVKYGRTTPISVAVILDSNGLDDTLWTLVNACGGAGERIAWEFACDCAERVLHIYERDYPGDPRPRTAVAMRRRWLAGQAGDEEMAAARAAAWDAARDAARVAAWDAARAAARDAARAAAWAAAWDAAWAAAWDAARDAARAAAWDAARAAAWDAARAAARAAEQAWQTNHLRDLLSAMAVEEAAQ